MNSSLERRKNTIAVLTWTYIVLYAFLSIGADILSCYEIGLSHSELGAEETDVPLDVSLIKMSVCLLLFYVASLVLFFFYVRQLWKEIPDQFASLHPGEAAGFSLIPLICCFWWFKSILGLVGDMNKYIVHHRCGSIFPTPAIGILCAVWVVSHLVEWNDVFSVFFQEDTGFSFFDILGILFDLVETAVTCWGVYYLHTITLQFMDMKKAVNTK